MIIFILLSVFILSIFQHKGEKRRAGGECRLWSASCLCLGSRVSASGSAQTSSADVCILFRQYWYILPTFCPLLFPLRRKREKGAGLGGREERWYVPGWIVTAAFFFITVHAQARGRGPITAIIRRIEFYRLFGNLPYLWITIAQKCSGRWTAIN